MRSRLLAALTLCLACGQAEPAPKADAKPAPAKAGEAEAPGGETKAGPAEAAPAEPAGHCQATQLEALVRTLADASPHARPDLVTRGLADACQVPPFLVRYFELSQRLGPGGPTMSLPDASEYQDLLRRACPDYDRMVSAMKDTVPAYRVTLTFDRCTLDRFGIVDRKPYLVRRPTSVIPFVAYQWLTEQGAEPSVILPIAQAIELFDRREQSAVQPTPNLRVPTTPARLDPVGVGAAVYLASDSLRTSDEKLLALTGGRLGEGSGSDPSIAALQEPLTATATTLPPPAQGRLLVIADEQVPYDTVSRVLTTAGQAGLSRFAFVMDTGTFEYGVVPVEPPKSDAEAPPAEAPPALMVTIDNGGFEILEPGKAKASPERIGLRAAADHEAWDFPALTTRAQAHRSAHPEARVAIVSSGGDIPYGVVVRTFAALRGPECTTREEEACVLPQVVVGPAKPDDGGGSPLDPPPPGKAGETPAAGLGHGPIGAGAGTSPGPAPQGGSSTKDEDPKAAIRRVIRSKVSDVRRCYEEALVMDPREKGRVSIEFVIARSGKVTSAKVASNGLKSKDVGPCIVKIIKGTKFPKHTSDPITVKYPFVFEASE